MLVLIEVQHSLLSVRLYSYTPVIPMPTPVHCQNSQQQMQYGKKASRKRQRDALGNALLGNLAC